MSDKVHYSDKEYEQVLLQLAQLMEQVDQIKDPETSQLFEQILRHFDAAHREGIARLSQFLEKSHPEVMTRIKKDFAIRHLFALYDVIEFNGVEQAKDPGTFISETDIKKIGE